MNILQVDGNNSVDSSQADTSIADSQTVLQPATNSQNNFMPGDRRSIVHRLHPDIPEPCWVEETDANGWCLIDQLGTWQSFLCIGANSIPA